MIWYLFELESSKGQNLKWNESGEYISGGGPSSIFPAIPLDLGSRESEWVIDGAIHWPAPVLSVWTKSFWDQMGRDCAAGGKRLKNEGAVRGRRPSDGELAERAKSWRVLKNFKTKIGLKLELNSWAVKVGASTVQEIAPSEKATAG